MGTTKANIASVILFIAVSGGMATWVGVTPADVGLSEPPPTPEPAATPTEAPSTTPETPPATTSISDVLIRESEYTPPPTPIPNPAADPDDPGPSSHTYENGVTLNSSAIERAIFERTNAVRRNQSLYPEFTGNDSLTELKQQSSLASVARAHSEDMADRDYFAHGNPDGEGPMDRYRGIGEPKLDCNGYGENILLMGTGTVPYRNLTTTKSVAIRAVDWWMHSPGHRANMLRPSWTHHGVGVYIAPDGAVYATQHFCHE